MLFIICQRFTELLMIVRTLCCTSKPIAYDFKDIFI